jgi:hypothetical protein
VAIGPVQPGPLSAMSTNMIPIDQRAKRSAPPSFTATPHLLEQELESVESRSDATVVIAQRQRIEEI